MHLCLALLWTAEIRYSKINACSKKGAPLTFSAHPCSFLSVTQIVLPRSSPICSLCLSVNVVILVLLAVAFLIIVERNLLNLSDFLYKEGRGMFTIIKCIDVKLDFGNSFAIILFSIQMQMLFSPLNRSCPQIWGYRWWGKERRSLSSSLLLKRGLEL